jgi:hypothetical protein
MADELTPDQKIEKVAENIALCEVGGSMFIPCPYCNALNKEGEPLCCRLFAIAAMAVISRQEIREQMDRTEQVLEKVLAN